MPTDHPAMVGHLLVHKARRRLKPHLTIHTHIDRYGPLESDSSDKYRKERLKDVRQEVKDLERVIKDFNPASAAAKVLSDVKSRLVECRARLAGMEAEESVREED